MFLPDILLQTVFLVSAVNFNVFFVLSAVASYLLTYLYFLLRVSQMHGLLQLTYVERIFMPMTLFNRTIRDTDLSACFGFLLKPNSITLSC